MEINIRKNRIVSPSKTCCGTMNENNAEILKFNFDEELEEYNKRIVFITDEGNKWDLLNDDNTYKLKRDITKFPSVRAYLLLTKENEEDWRSIEMLLKFNHNENADEQLITEEQTDGFNTMITILEDKKTTLEVIIADIESKLANGEFDGQDYILTEEDKAEIIETTTPMVQNALKPTLDSIEDIAEHAETIARGRATGYVFDTVEDLDVWLQNSENVSKLVFGWVSSSATYTFIKSMWVEEGETYVGSYACDVIKSANARIGAIVDNEGIIRQAIRSSAGGTKIGLNTFEFVAESDGWLYFAVDNNAYNIHIKKENSTSTEYEPYGYKIPVKTSGANLVKSVLVRSSLASYYTVLNIEAELLPSTTYTISFKGTAGNSLYINENVSETYKNFTISGDITTVTFTTKEGLSKDDTKQYQEGSGWVIFKNLNKQENENKFDELMLNVGSSALPYELYRDTTVINIYLDEPLRKIGEYVDYIDFKNQKLIRNVEVIDDTGTLTIEESLKGLETTTEETIELPTMPTQEGTNIIETDTRIPPSNMEVEYMRKGVG
ncbi:MAG: hypothetical protein IJ272_06795 [Clostridia bacterium]|nr:hypothetical protein [Clostridia bacterium]